MENAQTKALAPIDEVRGSLQQMESQFRMALPPQIGVEKFTRVVMTALQVSPSLLNCDRRSLFAACVKAAQDGLLPDGREGALVPYGGEVQWIPMVGGILKKVRNSGDLASIASQLIYSNDPFRYWVDDEGEHLTHDPKLFEDRGRLIGTYALAKTKDGHTYIEVMTSAQVQAVKACSKAKTGPWSGSFELEMWRKTVIRRLSKRLPMSTDLEQTISRNDDLYDLSKADEVQPEKGKKIAEMIGQELPKEPEKADWEKEAEKYGIMK